MQNPTHKSSNKRRRILWVIGVLVFAVAILAVLEKMQITDLIKLPRNVDEATLQAEEAKKNDVDNKQDFIESDDPTPAPTAQDSSAITLTATQEGQNVTVLTKLKDVADGTCKLTITSAGQTAERSAEVIYQSEFSTCAGFSVPTSAVPVGNWNITLAVTQSSGTVITKSITTEVR